MEIPERHLGSCAENWSGFIKFLSSIGLHGFQCQCVISSFGISYSRKVSFNEPTEKMTAIVDSVLTSQTKLYSFKFNCKIVSFTAAKTKRMFSVSVAQVKCEYIILSVSGFKSTNILRMNSRAAWASCCGPSKSGK